MVAFPTRILPKLRNRCSKACLGWGKALILGMGAGILLSSGAVAAERLVLNYGPFSRAISIRELKTFAETGETDSSTLDFLLNATEVNRKDVQTALTYEVGLDLDFVDSALYSLPGEYVLFEAGNIFHNKSRLANIQALRSAFTLSVSGDGKVSVLEFLQNYPNRDLYVDGVVLARTARDVSRFVKRAEKELEEVLAIAKDTLSSLICDCSSP